MTRDEAIQLMQSKLTNNNLRKHVLAVEAVMRFLARELKQDEEKWGLVGILHDLDYEETKNTPARHTLITAQILAEKGVDTEIIEAIKSHAYGFGAPEIKPPNSPIQHAIYSSDPITGLLVACALIHKEKRLAPIDVEFVKNRMKEKRFAAGANREVIAKCTNLGMDLDRFLQISLDAMKSISTELGL